jgi:DNA topoisomerase-1
MFVAEGKTTAYEGWMSFYKPYISPQSSSLPELHEGNSLKNNFVKMEENFSKAPNRYTQSSLLSRMEQEGIGTKATRADIIATLLKRAYLSTVRGQIEVTRLGLSIIESMRKYVPRIVSTELTKTMEDRLEMVEQGSVRSKEVIEGSIDQLIEALSLFREKKSEVGREIWEAAVSATAASESTVVGNCPVCKSGKLTVIRSRSTGKRFIGCSNYSSGCRASAPLPQRGVVTAARTGCEQCYWPKLRVKFARRTKPWVICANMQCPSKIKKNETMNHN